VPTALEALVTRCLEKEPEDRFESTRAILDYIQSEELVAASGM
jgi:hypothetical protein